MNKQAIAGAGIIGLFLYAATAAADISVSSRIDDKTGGDWRGTYGTCYSVVPWAPPAVYPEYQVGPDFEGDKPEQYIIPITGNPSAACISGAATDQFDFRIFTDSSPEPNPGHAFVWGFHQPGSGESNEVLADTPQWNACRSIFYPATFDGDLFKYEPLSGEIKLNTGGSATVAFYFLSEVDQCRVQKYKLYIDTVLMDEGQIQDLTVGKYVVFDITGLPEGGSTILLETEDVDLTDEGTLALCQNGGNSRLGPNSHLSGIFVDGTQACAEPSTDGCTPGFWKNTRKHLPAWVGYSPNQLFASVFEDAFPGMTLKDVLKQGGGGLKALGRHTVAALLNGANSDIDYGMSSAEVIVAFNEVFPGSKSEYTALKNEFAYDNERGCPINGKSAPIAP